MRLDVWRCGKKLWHGSCSLKDVSSAASLIEPSASARKAGLHYVSDSLPGLHRAGNGPRFRYIDAKGKVIRNSATLKRIKALVIPPAWTDVWISPDPDGHLQAVGRDARGRKQYRYHSNWREQRDSTKYHRMIGFGKALPRLRARVARDLDRASLDRSKVLATIVRLLEITSIRVGNEEYMKQNQSFGLTTLRDRHVQIAGQTIDFLFQGKSGKQHRISIRDRRLAGIVKRCRDIPGYELFQYLDPEGQPHSIGSTDVNGYLHDICGDEFTAKDFRTWNGTVLAATTLAALNPFPSQAEAKRNILNAVRTVADHLGNTVAVCRKCYVHPAVFDAYCARTLAECLQSAKPVRGLSADESAVLRFLSRTSRN